MKRVVYLMFLSFLIFITGCKKDELMPDQTDFKSLNFSFNSGKRTSDNSFLILGNNNNLTKISEDGTLLWQRNFNNIYFNQFLPLKNGNILFAETDYDSTDINGIDKGHINLYTYSESGSRIDSIAVFPVDSNHHYYDAFQLEEPNTGEILISMSYTDWSNSSTYCHTIKVLNRTETWSSKDSVENAYVYSSKIFPHENGYYFLYSGGGKINIQNKDKAGNVLWDKVYKIGLWAVDIANLYQEGSELILVGDYDASPDLKYNFEYFGLKINLMGDSVSCKSWGTPKQDFCQWSFKDGNDIVMGGGHSYGEYYYKLTYSSIKIVKMNPVTLEPFFEKIIAEREGCTSTMGLINKEDSYSIIGIKQAFENPAVAHGFFMKINKDGTL